MASTADAKGEAAVVPVSTGNAALDYCVSTSPAKACGSPSTASCVIRADNLRFVGVTFSGDACENEDEGKNECKAMAELLKQKQLECRNLNAKLFQCDIDYEELQNKLRHMEDSLLQSTVDNKALRERCTALVATNDLLRTQASVSQRAEVDHSMADTVRSLVAKQSNSFRKENAGLKRDIEKLEEQVAFFRGQQEDATARAENIHREWDRERRRCAELADEVESLKDQLSQTHRSSEDEARRTSFLTQDHEELKIRHQASLAELKKLIEQKTKDYDDLREKFDAAKAEAHSALAILRDQQTALENVQRQSEAEISRLRTDLIYKEAELTSFRDRLKEPLRATPDRRRSTVESTLVEQVRKLSQEIEALRENNADNSAERKLHEELGSLRTTKLFLEGRLETYKLENETLTAKLTGAEEDIAQLKEELAHMKELLAEKDNNEKATYTQLLEDLSKAKQQKAELRCKFRELEREHTRLKQQSAAEASEKASEACQELRTQLASENARFLEAKRNLELRTTEADDLRQGNVQHEKRIDILEKHIAMLERKVADAATGSDEYKAQTTKEVKNLVALTTCLKAACADLDKQVDDSEKLRRIQGEKIDSLTNQLDNMAGELRTEKSTVERLKADLDSERRERHHLSEKAAALQEELGATHEDYRSDATDKLAKFNAERNAFRSKISSLEATAARAVSELAMLKGRLNDVERERDHFSEQMDQLSSTLASEKNGNFKLKQGMAEAIDKLTRYKAEREDALALVEDERKRHALEVQKLNGQITQHSKLNTYLQERLDTPRKAGGIMSAFAVKDAKTSPSKAFATIMGQEQELQEALKAERNVNAELKNQLHRLQGHLNANASNGSLAASSAFAQNSEMSILKRQPAFGSTSTISNGGNSTIGTDQISSSTRVAIAMHHNIPHRWKGHLVLKSAKCVACMDGLPFLRYALKCRDCGIVVHPHCSGTLLNTCGLPMIYTEFYEENNAQNKSPVSENASVMAGRMRGWIKYLRPDDVNADWQSVYAILEKGVLKFYDNENFASSNAEPIDFLDFVSDTWKLRYRPLVEGDGRGSVAKQDIPYVLQVSGNEQKQQRRNVIFMMAPTLEAKQRWYQAFQAVTNHKIAMRRDPSALHMTSSVFARFEEPNKLHVHCAAVYAGNVLLGCEEGLYFAGLKESNAARPVQLCQVEVCQFEVVAAVSTLVVIVGQDRKPMVALLGELDAILRRQQTAPLKLTPLAHDLCLIHRFCVGQPNGQPLLCLADPEQITLMEFSQKRQIFTVMKQIPTREPSNCLLFAGDFLVVGAEIFLKVDFPSLAVKEFLDADDESLASVMSAAVKDRNYPIAVVEISSNKQTGDVELLLCFETFGVFANQHGRKTRSGEIEFLRAVQDIVYTAPYLMVSHFESMEIFEVPSTIAPDLVCLQPRSLQLIELARPRIVGFGLNEGDVFVASTKLNLAEVIIFNAVSSLQRQNSSKDKRKRLVSFNVQSADEDATKRSKS